MPNLLNILEKFLTLVKNVWIMIAPVLLLFFFIILFKMIIRKKNEWNGYYEKGFDDNFQYNLRNSLYAIAYDY